jgi:hypothetical protein
VVDLALAGGDVVADVVLTRWLGFSGVDEVDFAVFAE